MVAQQPRSATPWLETRLKLKPHCTEWQPYPTTNQQTQQDLWGVFLIKRFPKFSLQNVLAAHCYDYLRFSWTCDQFHSKCQLYNTNGFIVPHPWLLFLISPNVNCHKHWVEGSTLSQRSSQRCTQLHIFRAFPK